MKIKPSTQSLILYGIVIIIFISQVFLLARIQSNTTKLIIEKVQIAKQNNENPNYIPAEKLVILESDIKRVEQVNDKRFELLGWGAAILLTTLSALLIINFINSKASLRDVVYEELHGENSTFKKQFEELMAEIKVKKEELEREISTLIEN